MKLCLKLQRETLFQLEVRVYPFIEQIPGGAVMSDAHDVLITDLSWGEIEVTIQGEAHQFRDCKLWPGGAKEWDWNETGTQHSPGIQVADFEDVLRKDVDVVILSRGQNKRLRVKKETVEYLRERDVDYHVAETREAVKLFNQLAKKGERVGGLFHTTC